MRRRLFSIAVAVCALVTAGCGADGSSGDRARTVPQDTATAAHQTGKGPAKQLSDGQLRAALLTVQDMPTGFTVDTDTSKDSAGTLQGCEQLDGLNQNAGTGLDIEAKFTKGGFGPFVSETLGQKDEKEAKAAVDKFADALSSCKTAKSTGTDGKVTEFHLSPLSFPKLGDDTFALRMSADAEGLTIGIDVIVVRRAGVMLVVLNAGVGSPDSAITETVARKALAKVDKALA
jgi:hypothetical protein